MIEKLQHIENTRLPKEIIRGIETALYIGAGEHCLYFGKNDPLKKGVAPILSVEIKKANSLEEDVSYGEELLAELIEEMELGMYVDQLWPGDVIVLGKKTKNGLKIFGVGTDYQSLGESRIQLFKIDFSNKKSGMDFLKYCAENPRNSTAIFEQLVEEELFTEKTFKTAKTTDDFRKGKLNPFNDVIGEKKGVVVIGIKDPKGKLKIIKDSRIGVSKKIVYKNKGVHKEKGRKNERLGLSWLADEITHGEIHSYQQYSLIAEKSEDGIFNVQKIKKDEVKIPNEKLFNTLKENGILILDNKPRSAKSFSNYSFFLYHNTSRSDLAVMLDLLGMGYPRTRVPFGSMYMMLQRTADGWMLKGAGEIHKDSPEPNGENLPRGSGGRQNTLSFELGFDNLPESNVNHIISILSNETQRTEELRKLTKAVFHSSENLFPVNEAGITQYRNPFMWGVKNLVLGIDNGDGIVNIVIDERPKTKEEALEKQVFFFRPT